MKRKALALGAAGLALGLVIGGITSASAVTSSTSGTTSPNPVVAGACDLGLRLGQTMRDSGARMVDIAAKLTGMEVEDIRTERQAGKSLADITEAKGVSADKLVSEALDARKELLDAKVKDSTITQEQADQALENMETRLTDRVNSTATGGGMGRGGGGGGRGMGGGGGRGAGGGCGGTCTQAPVTQ